jgi:OOP family OmpA-OmpF porin
MKHLATIWASVLALLTFAGAANAQTSEGFAIDRFDPSERGSEWFVLDTLDMRGHVRPAIGLVGDYGYKPLVFYDNTTGDETQALIKHQLYAHVGASLVLWERLRLGVNLPIALLTKGDGGTSGGVTYAVDSGVAMGDLRVAADVRLFGEYRSPISMALGVGTYLPTGSQEAYAGDGKVRVAPRLLIAGEVGPFAYSARAGYNFRLQDGNFNGQPIGNEIAWAAAAGFRVADGHLLLGPEIYGTAVTEGGDFNARGNPIEGILGGHYTAGDVRFGLGAGTGLTRGFGSPQVRVVAMLEWAPQIEKEPPPPPAPADRDDDGIIDAEDACPDEPGKASDDPKKNGCPLRDKDEDGIFDDDDACPEVKGVENEDPKKNGCPPDKDEDGILDDDDACPDEKGEKNEDPKKNGCPPPKDTDGDGIIDPEDACPTAAGPRNEDPKKHGCPEARIEKGQIRIIEQVKFKTGSDVILPVSDSILQAVLNIMKEHPEIGKLGIEGHTDNRGAAQFNKNLSKKRAASVVRWLTNHGVEAGRLQSAGYGFERPLDSNDTEEGRAANRRVEFHLLEMDGKPYDSSND